MSEDHGAPPQPEPFGESFSAASVTPAPAPAPARPSRPSLVRLLVAVIVILGLVVVLESLMVFAPSIAPLKLGSTRSAIEAKTDDEIEAVASRFARNFLSIDYRTLDADFSDIQKDTTGKLRGDLSRILTLIREPYRNTKSTSTGRVTEVRVLSRTDDTASVGVIVELTVRNKRQRAPQTATRSMQLTLVRTPSGWRVSDAQNLPTPSAEGS
jgi:hypothetical protein